MTRSETYVQVRLSCGTVIRIERDQIDITVHGDPKPQFVRGALVVKKGTPVEPAGLRDPWKKSLALLEWDDLWHMVPEDLDAMIELMTWAKLRWEGDKHGS